MSFFLTLRSVQTLPDPKVVDGIKIELFGATSITRKIILEGGIVTVDDGSRSGSGNGATVGANDSPLTIFETTSHYDYDQTGCTNFSTSNECSAYKCQECKAKHDGVINASNALTASVKEMTFKRGVIPSKRTSYPYTLLEIKAAKRRRKDISKVDVTAKSTAEAYNITVYNPSTASKIEEKVEPISSGERKNYPFERFNILDKAPKKLTQLINDYSKWIADGLLKHHADSIPAGLPWHLVDEMYILINCGDEFHWVWAVVDLKERCIRVYDSMSRTRRSGTSAEIQRNCNLYVVAYAEYLSNRLQVPNNGFDTGLLRKRYTALLWKYGEAKGQKPYASDTKDLRRPNPNSIIPDEEQLVHID
ncbi:hypothetical protein BC332_13093 [Capsicum chinense]|nr:hypothetical protein BC332_13093 [Capsicum chinense]